jgi:hypothetical protein
MQSSLFSETSHCLRALANLYKPHHQSAFSSPSPNMWFLSSVQKLFYNWGQSLEFQKPTVASIRAHTMGASLSAYLRMKVHPDIQVNTWSRIIVKGEHQRDTTIARIPSNEKMDKPFNWQRPTASVDGSGTLELRVFPGIDYVEHHAAIVATYLSLEGRNPSSVQYILPSPKERLMPLLDSNLSFMGAVDIVVIGYVDGVDRWTQGPWDCEDDLFSWKITTTKRGYRLAFLGCRICFWGDIGGNVVRVLQRLNGVNCVLYVGKLGSLRAKHIPNHSLASGGQSLLLGKMVTWKNPLEPHLHHAPSVKRGVHCSLGSVLNETKAWLHTMEGRCDFVDPEIGHMAKASLEGGTEYGYLHIISDNLARKYQQDLSNERRKDVVQGRKQLMGEIQDVLGNFFDSWSPK